MRILGLDINTRSIKAVEIESAFRRFQVLDYYEEKLEAGATQADGIQRLISGLAKRPERSAVALSNRQVTFRNLKLPIRDKKAIQTSLAFELEDELPFDLDSAQTSYVPLAQGSFGTHLHVAATLKKHVGELVSQLISVGVDPDLVTTEAWAFRTILNRTLGRAAQEKPILLAQLGDQRSTLYIHWKGQPVYTKEVLWGGSDQTLALSRRFSISINEAEKRKVTQSAIIGEGDQRAGRSDSVEISEVIAQATLPLITEMRQADLSSKSLTGGHLGTVLLSGGPALLPGLMEFIRSQMRVPTENMRALHVLSNGQTDYSQETESTFFLATALAACLLPDEKGQMINFRRGVFAKTSQGSGWKIRSIKKPLVAGLCVLACFHIGNISKRTYYETEIKKSEEKVEKSMKQVLGDLPKSTVKTKLASPSNLKKEVQKQVDDAKVIAKAFEPDRTSPSLALRGLSKLVPKDILTDLIRFEATKDRTLDMTFIVRSPQAGERLKEILSKHLDDFQPRALEPTTLPDVQEKRWRLTVRGTANQGFYER